MYRHTRKTLLALALVPLVWPVAAGAAVHTVTQIGDHFSPSSITVAPGDTVRWVWTSGIHTVTSGTPCTADGRFHMPLDSFHPIFEYVVPTSVAHIPYFCVPHCGMGMTGDIYVQSTEIVNFIITMDGFQEVPPASTPATGSGTATLDTLTGLFTWNFSFSGLTAAETAAHFHGPAGTCSTAGIVVGLPLGSPKIGSAGLNATQIAQVLAGLWYVNVHTSTYPAGEIRGRVAPLPLSDPLPDIAPGDIAIDLQPIATGLVAPNWGTAAPGDASRLFVVDQVGTLWAIDLGSGSKSVFLDVSSRLVTLGIGGAGTFDERGFLGVAFHPDYQSNGLLYTYTSEPATGTPDFTTMPLGSTPNCQSVVLEWQVPTPSDPASLPGDTPRELLRIDQPQFNHNGGALAFGPDGLLYIALGDGGGRDDRDDGASLGVPIVGHGCEGNGQNLNSILGKIVRIDPLGSDSANGAYGIPADNPFVGAAGLDEIWAYGLRNPWRISFDRATGELYIADVGQNDIEGINIGASGANYGWRWKEGSFTFLFNGNQPGYVTDEPLDVPAGLTDPIAEYDHDDGTAVVGGFVFRGTTRPQLVGKYVFGEFALTFSNDGRLFYLDAGDQIKEFQLNGMTELGLSLLGFGEDAKGEIYVLANSTGTPFGTSGVVLRVALLGDLNCDGLVNAFDIDPFVMALTDPAGYAMAYPDCDARNADVNGDGLINAFDIDPFVLVLTGG
jgi:glucose/arabinose dehydrogenase/plastocyanin